MNDDRQLLADFFDVLLISAVWLCVYEILESVGCDFVSHSGRVVSALGRVCDRFGPKQASAVRVGQVSALQRAISVENQAVLIDSVRSD
jgi:hypothetical protein